MAGGEERLLEGVPGFGKCGECKYRVAGFVDVCYPCAGRTYEALPPLAQRCGVCDQPFETPAKACGNWLCRNPDRQFDWNLAAAMMTGELEKSIKRYKYGKKWGWALIFGRVLAGLLAAEHANVSRFDMIIASPTFTGRGARHGRFDHTRGVLSATHLYSPDSHLEFDVVGAPAVVKTADTPPLASTSGLAKRKEIAAGPLRASLRVPDKKHTRGRHILVYDDVFTDGSTLNEVARVLREQGSAEQVCGVTLARQPWKKV